MKLRTVLRIGALAAWLLAVAPITATYGAESGSAPEYGWWNRQQALPAQGDPSGLGVTTVPTVPAPATVPADGLYVATDPSGPSAISALRYVGGGAGTLTLLVADGTTLTGTEKIVACPVQGGFTPAQNGAWASKPGYDPATCTVPGTPADDGSSFSFEIPSSFASAVGDVQVVIAPAADAAAFSLPFDKPADDSFVVTAPVSDAAASDAGAYSFDPGSTAYSSPGASSTPDYAAPSSPSVSTPAATSAGGTAPLPVVPAALPAALRHASRTDQIAAVALLCLIGAAFWFLSNRAQRLPRLLGSVGGHAAEASEAATQAAERTTRPRGVGRFARHRTAPPTAI